MRLSEIINNFSTGGFVTFIIVILSLIEITPIKISPLSWIGKRANKEVIDRVEKIEQKLDEHIAQDYRSKIMHFQSTLIREGVDDHTMEEWKEVIKACKDYEEYCKDNNIDNGYCVEAISFIRSSYQMCLKDSNFADIKTLRRDI